MNTNILAAGGLVDAIWVLLYAALFVGAVVGGFWVCARAQFPKPVYWAFGAIVLLVLIFFLVYLVNDGSFNWPRKL